MKGKNSMKAVLYYHIVAVEFKRNMTKSVKNAHSFKKNLLLSE